MLQLPARSWHELPRWYHGLCMRYVVSCGSTSFPWTVVRLQEIPSGSINRNSSTNRAKLRLVLDIFSSAIMNDLFMTFTSRLKVDAKCVYQQ